MQSRVWFGCLAVVAAMLIPAPAMSAGYEVLARYRLGGDGGWDYLTYDSGSHRLFVARASRVQVLDPSSGRLLAEIPGTPGVHGIALAVDLDKGYTSNGGEDALTVFALGSLQVLGKIATPQGQNPDAIVYDPSTRSVVAFNGRSHNASVVDAVSDRWVATIALAGKPESAVADGTGVVFVNIEDTNEIARVDLRRGQVTGHWPLPGCVEPTGLAMDVATRRLFVGCHNRTMLVVDADRGSVVAHLPIGAGVDANAFDPGTRLAFSAQGDGTLTIVREVSPDAYVVEQTAATQLGARTLALDAADHRVYLVSAEFEAPPPPSAASSTRRSIKPGSFVLLVVGVPH